MKSIFSPLAIAAVLFSSNVFADGMVPALKQEGGAVGSSSSLMRSALAENSTPVSLDSTGKSAVTQGKKWLDAHNTPSKGLDGRVTYTYGAGQPTVICAPLRLCVIELQSGEVVLDKPLVGDSVRWHITPGVVGTGKTAQILAVIKPTEAGLDTSLVINTNKRNYYIRLISSEKDYISRVNFSYPQDEMAEWEEITKKRAELTANEIASDLGSMSIERLNFDYKIEGEESFKPVRVIDNGEKTYLQLPATSKADEIPVLVILNQEGKEQLVNSRYINGWFEVDRLFDRAALIIGVGKQQRKITVTNNKRYKSNSFFGG